MAQQSARRGQENQCFPQGFEHALGEMDQARELPYRPAAAQRRIRGRTDGSIRLRATAILKFSLARKGASTDGKRPSGAGRKSTLPQHAGNRLTTGVSRRFGLRKTAHKTVPGNRGAGSIGWGRGQKATGARSLRRFGSRRIAAAVNRGRGCTGSTCCPCSRMLKAERA